MLYLLFSLNGRIGRLDYILTSLSLKLICVLAVGALGSILKLAENTSPYTEFAAGVFVTAVLLCMVPMLLWILFALIIKRLHDQDKSGWWIFISLVPIIGNIWFLILIYFIKGTEGPNQYGEDSLK